MNFLIEHITNISSFHVKIIFFKEIMFNSLFIPPQTYFFLKIVLTSYLKSDITKKEKEIKLILRCI